MNAYSPKHTLVPVKDTRTFFGQTVRHRLWHDRGLGAWTAFVVGGVLAVGVIAGVTLYEHSERDAVLPLDAERAVAVYGHTIDIDVTARRNVPVCQDSKMRRRLVIYDKGQRFPATPRYVMNIQDDNIISLSEGQIETHLIADLPADIKPGAGWAYEPIPVNACPWFERLLPWYHDIRQKPGALIPVKISLEPTPAMIAQLPYTPRVPEPNALAVP